MNEFYSIAPINTTPTDSFQLQNFGLERVTMSVGSSRRDGYGGHTWQSTDIKSKVTSEDYDGAIAFKIIKVKPPYELENLLNYHLEYYVNKGGEKVKFIKQIKYCVLPYMQKHYSKEKSHIELTEKWVLENEPNNKINKMDSLNINGSNNIINNAGGDIHQSGITIIVSNNQYQELKELGVDEKQISELKDIVSNHSQDKPTFKSRITKWLGAVTVSVATKGLIENLPKIQEFAHHLLP